MNSNHPAIYKKIVAAFDEDCLNRLARDSRNYIKTTDKGHGRNDARKVWGHRDGDWFAQSKMWPGIRSLILVESHRKRRGISSYKRRAYISITDESAERIAAKVRGHWYVENKLHWVLDVTFGEDRSRIARK